MEAIWECGNIAGEDDGEAEDDECCVWGETCLKSIFSFGEKRRWDHLRFSQTKLSSVLLSDYPHSFFIYSILPSFHSSPSSQSLPSSPHGHFQPFSPISPQLSFVRPSLSPQHCSLHPSLISHRPPPRPTLSKSPSLAKSRSHAWYNERNFRKRSWHKRREHHLHQRLNRNSENEDDKSQPSNREWEKLH